MDILNFLWTTSRQLEFCTVLITQPTDVYRSLIVPDFYVASILDSKLSNSYTELIAVVIMGLVRFIKAKNYIEHVPLKNKYLT